MHQTPATRDAILDAAERLFATQGFAATTIKKIGAEAGVNSALLYYYFDDKETLYRETLRRLVQTFVATGVRQLERATSPEGTLRQLVDFQVEFILTHPHMPRLLARELIEYQAAHAEEQLTYVAANLFQRVCDTIRGGQEQGVFRPDLDPKFAAVSIVAQVIWVAIAKPAVGILLGHGVGGAPPEAFRAFGRHAADFAISALTCGVATPSHEHASR